MIAVDERVSENQQAEETLIVPLESDLITVDEGVPGFRLQRACRPREVLTIFLCVVEEPVFTEEQLEALYENSELKVNKEFVDNFLKVPCESKVFTIPVVIVFYPRKAIKKGTSFMSF